MPKSSVSVPIQCDDNNYLDGRKFNSKSIGHWGRHQAVEGDGTGAGVEDEQLHGARTRVRGDEAEV